MHVIHKKFSIRFGLLHQDDFTVMSIRFTLRVKKMGIFSWYPCVMYDFSDTPRLNLSVQSHSEEFFSDRVLVTVLLEWTISLSQIYYQQLLRNVSVDIAPDPEVIMTNIENMSVQLTLQYNTLYNVNITQPGICGQPNQTTFIQLNYSK